MAEWSGISLIDAKGHRSTDSGQISRSPLVLVWENEIIEQMEEQISVGLPFERSLASGRVEWNGSRAWRRFVAHLS
jgi:hypothetical protein